MDRALGRADGNRDREVRIGYDYGHSLVGDHSRPAYSETFVDEQGTTCAALMERATAYLAAHGITRIERLITEARVHRWSLRHVCTDHRITQEYIRPRRTWQNGKDDQLSRTLGNRVGLPARLRLQPSPPRRPCIMVRALRHSTTPLGPRRAPTHQPTGTDVTTSHP